jgi:LacI family transcriptional regulator
MPTIKDVAARAGVSFTTVSHVLNDTRAVRAETRERVMAAARELDYVPSAVARSLRHQVTHTVGLLVPDSTNPFFAELARGIENACYRAGYSVLLCNSDDAAERQLTYLRVLRQKQVDGLIVASARDDAPWVAALAELPFPRVVVDREIAGLRCDLIQVDNLRGGALAARHLLELGHRAVGCVAGRSGINAGIARLRGFERALAQAGVRIPGEWRAPGDFRAEGGYRAALAILRAPARPTAIFACNDLMAVGVLRAAAELGIAVPGELSVVGFDDVELSSYVHPALTTVAQSIRELGEVTVAALLARIARPAGKPVRRRLAPELRIRGSTSSPPGARAAARGGVR